MATSTKLLPIFFFFASLQANATCVHGTSSNSVWTPVMITTGNDWTGNYSITNVSNVPVTVKLTLTDMNGNPYVPSVVTYLANFSATNTPIDTAGTVLQAGQLGVIVINDPATARINVGKISWSSDSCLDTALLASYQNQYLRPGVYGPVFTFLNDGKPF